MFYTRDWWIQEYGVLVRNLSSDIETLETSREESEGVTEGLTSPLIYPHIAVRK